MSQAVSGHAVVVEMRVQSRASPCGVYGGQSGIGTVFFLSVFLFYPVSINLPMLNIHSFIFSFFLYIYFADRASQYIYLNINQLDALNFMMSLFHASICFEHMCLKHVEA